MLLTRSPSLIPRHFFVDVAPEPAFAGFGRGHYGVIRRPEVPGGVLVGRRIATERDAAGLAGTQVNPRVAGFYALIALVRLGRPHRFEGR